MSRAVLLLAFAASLVVVAACESGPPKRLVPEGAKVLRELPRREALCYVHRSWTMSASADQVATWAAKNDLPCADDTKPCVHWSTERRSAPPFWKEKSSGEPNGLDTVDATYGSGQITVDWGDYTCSGPN